MPVRIVTDSTADLPPEQAAQHRIAVVPLTVCFGDEELLDGVDITTDEFFERLPHESRVTTSQPSPAAFLQTYRRLEAEGATGILSVHLPAALSGTLASAIQAAREVKTPVAHVDSGLVTLALGLGVVAAAEAAASGATLDEARDIAVSQFERTHIFIVLESVEYLRRGGRIGRAQGMLGKLLNVKPVLSLHEGEIVPLTRARTRRRAIDYALRRIDELRPLELLGAVHAAAPEALAELVAQLREFEPDVPIVTGELGPVIGVHGGPGTVGVGVISARDAEAAG